MSNAAVLPDLTVEGAERLTERISARLEAIATNHDAVMPLIREAINRNAHAVLGYPSLGAYVKDRFGNSLEKLDPSLRRGFVKEMSDAGMSTRAIAPVVGVSPMQVSRDIREDSGVTDVTPVQDVPDLPVDGTTGEVFEADDELPPAAEVALPRPVVGLDGKTYTTFPARPLKAVPTGEEAAKQNAEQGATELARAVFTLVQLDFTVRYRNLRNAQIAYNEWRVSYDAALPVLMQFGTFGAAQAAGGFPPATEQSASAAA